MNYTPYSFSKISTYNSCPKKFEFQFVLKVGDVNLDTPALAKGRCVHSILEYYPNVPDDIKENEMFGEAKEVCDKFLSSKLGHYVLSDKPKFVEQKIGLNKKLQPCDYKDEDVLFKGIVDQIIIDDILMINDFKTGKYRDIKYQSFDQLMFYAIYFFIKFPNISKIQISYLYVEHNLENKIQLEREFLDNYKKQLLTNIINIENDKIFNYNYSRLCDWCGFNVMCEKYLKEKNG